MGNVASSPISEPYNNEAAPVRVSNLVLRLKSSMERLGWAPRDLFAQLDLNKDGNLSIGELERLTLQLEPDLSAKERQLLFDSIDLDRNGAIDAQEFCAIFQVHQYQNLHARCAHLQRQQWLLTSIAHDNWAKYVHDRQSRLPHDRIRRGGYV